MLNNMAVQSGSPEIKNNNDGNNKNPGNDASGNDGSGETKRPIANANNPGGYYNRLEEEWQNAPEEGYVWTISFDGVEVLDILGIR